MKNIVFSIIVAPLSEVLSILWHSTTRPFIYTFGHKRIIERLKEHVSELKKATNRQRLVGYHIKWSSRQFLNPFDFDLYTEALDLLQSIAKFDQKPAWRRDLLSRYIFSRKALHITIHIEILLLRQAEFFFSSMNDIYGNSSRGMLSTKELVNALRDDEIVTLGVFGVNIARNRSELVKVCEMALEEDLFSEVAIVVVSPGEDYLTKIQEDLAKSLNLPFKETQCVFDRANLLCEKITCGRILIILDCGILNCVTINFDLKAVGIPVKEGDHNNGCKVVIVSQEEHVCEKMGAQEIIYIPGFDNEIWDVFTQNTGNWVQNAGATSIAYLLADKCGDEPTKLAEYVEAWIKEIKEPVSASNPQMQIAKADHRIKIGRH